MRKYVLMGWLMLMNVTMSASVVIKQLQLNQINEVKLFLASTYREVLDLRDPLETVAQKYFYEEDNVQSVYFDNGGTYLILVDGSSIVGTGAIRKLDCNVAELNRMYLNKAYRSQGLGKLLANELLAFAKKNGYKKIRLDIFRPLQQQQAIDFYKKLGFYEIERYNESQSQYFMEKILDERNYESCLHNHSTLVTL